MKEIVTLNNEDGSVLILALIMLVLLTLIGISATTTSMIEINIAGNERAYKRNLYSAEAAVMQCAQNMEQTDLQNPGPTWLGLIGAVTEPDDIRLTSFWEAPGGPFPQLGVVPDTLFVATSKGYAGGAQGDIFGHGKIQGAYLLYLWPVQTIQFRPDHYRNWL